MKNLQAFGIAILVMLIYVVMMLTCGTLHVITIRYFYETYGPWASIYYQCTMLLSCFCVMTYIYYRKFKDEV